MNACMCNVWHRHAPKLLLRLHSHKIASSAATVARACGAGIRRSRSQIAFNEQITYCNSKRVRAWQTIIYYSMDGKVYAHEVCVLSVFGLRVRQLCPTYVFLPRCGRWQSIESPGFCAATPHRDGVCVNAWSTCNTLFRWAPFSAHVHILTVAYIIHLPREFW